MGKGNVFVVVIDFPNLHFTYNISIIAELQREVTSIPLLTGLFTLRNRLSANKDETLLNYKRNYCIENIK